MFPSQFIIILHNRGDLPSQIPFRQLYNVTFNHYSKLLYYFSPIYLYVFFYKRTKGRYLSLPGYTREVTLEVCVPVEILSEVRYKDKH